MILETERLTLAPVVQGDAPAIYLMMSDPEVMAHWDVEPIEDPDVVEAYVAAQVREVEEGAGWYWSMRLIEDGVFLGVCDLSDVDWRHHRAEVGFMMGKDSWGKGYAFEAMASVLAFAASQGLKRLTARTHVGNVRSDSLLAKLGFKQEGYLHGHIDREGERRDCRLWGMLL
ncbi:RimJ/RimL family protein N-acetyltransferase [Caulobacter ginsengisoli]|uniref:RimJ/RimL family protein N-acetyltransferase n=1 Tax=Caulobacter ginsengisoli TaxID=400775 RepID=A0ABU0IPE5_9CAUL|nr:GNAT family N-acetyltransferase [Caulobacter ginsengisoli]MDQ0463048.1 RimJ/RimL family protein N-acetyltransferase [Caulobacter ginsengisoli]